MSELKDGMKDDKMKQNKKGTVRKMSGRIQETRAYESKQKYQIRSCSVVYIFLTVQKIVRVVLFSRQTKKIIQIIQRGGFSGVLKTHTEPWGEGLSLK